MELRNSTLLILISAGLLVYFSIEILIVIFIGISLGVITEPLVEKISRFTKLNRGIATNLSYGAVVLALIGIATAIGKFFSDQFKSFSRKLPNLADSLRDKVDDLLDESPISEDASLETVGTAVEAITKPLLSGMNSGVTLISCLTIGFVLAYYYSKNPTTYKNIILQVVPSKHRETAERTMSSASSALRTWFSAQFISQIAVGLLTALGLWLVDTEYWLVYGLLSVLLCFIPYVGILLVVLIATTVSLASGSQNIPEMLLVFFLVQQIEGNIILPKFMRSEAALPEIALLIGILLLGYWFGLVGAFIAPPVMVILFSLLHEFKILNKNEPSAA